MNLQLNIGGLQKHHFANPAYLQWLDNSIGDDDYRTYRAERVHQSPSSKTILSVFDYSGRWAQPYIDAGYNVVSMDIKHGHDVNDFSVDYLTDYYGLCDVYGILAALPCTEFATSGARWFQEKDEDGRTQAAVELAYQTLRTVELFAPEFWAIENPVGRLRKLVTELDCKPWYFNPCDFAKDIEGEAYTKKTGLYGQFTPPTVANIGEDRSASPILGSLMHTRYGGNSERTKIMRSMTPEGFAQAFFECNQ